MTTVAKRLIFIVCCLTLSACASTSNEQVSYSRALNALDTETPMRDGRTTQALAPNADMAKIKDVLKQSLNAYQAKNFSEAEALYYQAEELGANDETILFWLGNFSILSGDVDSARHYYEDLLRINPLNAKALYNLATVYLSKAENYFQFYTASVPEESVERDLLQLLASIDRFSDTSQKEVEDKTLSPLDSLRQLLEQ